MLGAAVSYEIIICLLGMSRGSNDTVNNHIVRLQPRLAGGDIFADDSRFGWRKRCRAVQCGDEQDAIDIPFTTNIAGLLEMRESGEPHTGCRVECFVTGCVVRHDITSA